MFRKMEEVTRNLAALISLACNSICPKSVAAVIILGLGALIRLFVLVSLKGY